MASTGPEPSSSPLATSGMSYPQRDLFLETMDPRHVSRETMQQPPKKGLLCPITVPIHVSFAVKTEPKPAPPTLATCHTTGMGTQKSDLNLPVTRLAKTVVNLRNPRPKWTSAIVTPSACAVHGMRLPKNIQKHPCDHNNAIAYLS